MEKFELFKHGSDIGVRGRGSSLNTAFEQAALALTNVITAPILVKPLKERTIVIDAPNVDILLIDWLNAIIYEMATAKMLFSEYKLTIESRENGLHLQANLKGENIDRARHQPAVEPKGATFAELKVEKLSEDHWQAQCIIDV